MPRFFVSGTVGETYVMAGDDALHISKSLRMCSGEVLTLCNTQGIDFLCEITSVGGGEVRLKKLSEKKTESEPSCKVTLFQGVPKGDKLEGIVQKAVELGANEVVPVMMSRCISRPDTTKADKKRDRWQKIALEAAKQCGRGIIPTVHPITNLSCVPDMLSQFDKAVLCYECGGKGIRETISPDDKSVAVIIGPEGGIAPEEYETLTNAGATAITLGKRILRTETAPLAALSLIMYQTGNME